MLGASLLTAMVGLGATTSSTDHAKDHLASVVVQEKSENAVLKREVKRLRKSNHDWHDYARSQEIAKARLLSLVTALRRKLHPPAPSLGGIPPSIYRAFICIHRGEGSWTDSGDPYWGGLQMDRSFMQTYGSWAIKRYHGWANVWPPSVQIAVAYKAYSSGRGFYPWPNTARNCGLI